MPMARHQWRFLPSALAVVARRSRACPAGSRASLHIADRHPFGSQLFQGMAGDLHRRADGEQRHDRRHDQIGPSGAGAEYAERCQHDGEIRSEEHTSELQSLMRISYAVFCLKKKINKYTKTIRTQAWKTQQKTDKP